MAAWAIVASLLVLAGCGSESERSTRKTGQSDTPAPRTTERSTFNAGAAAAQERAERRQRRRAEAQRALHDYYDALNSGNYARAWRMLGPAQQASFGGFARWAAGYDRTVRTDLTITDAQAVNSSGKRVALSVALDAVDVDVCGNRIAQTFTGTWQLQRQHGTWVTADVSVTKTGGGEVITDVETCPGVDGPPGTPAYEPPTVPGVVYIPHDYSDYDGSYLGGPTTRDFGSGLGSIGRCRDGTYSDSVGRQGACSHHGGVAP